MKYLVDANVLSEATKTSPREQVIEWLDAHEAEIGVDPLVLGEIRLGIFLLPAGARRRRLEHWYVEVVEAIRCVPWEARAAVRWAKLVSEQRSKGRLMPMRDSLIAATALSLDLILVTRNVGDFRHAGVKLLDPFALP